MQEKGVVSRTYDPDEVKKTPLQFLQMTSVRMYEGDSDVVPVRVSPPSWYDPDECVTAEEKRGKKKNKQKKLKTQKAEDDAVRFGLHTDEGVATSSPIYKAVEKAVRVLAPTAVTKVYQRGQGVNAVYTARTKFRHCLNVGREHASNNVWFSLSYHGVYQRCFDDGCVGYQSDTVPIPEPMHSVLFPVPHQGQGAQEERSNQTMASALRLASKISYNPRGGRKRKASSWC
eukprot:jgi/Mesvir1/18583/Mv17092-RA.1